MAAGDLCQISDVKAWLPNQNDSDDQVLARLITAVSTKASQYLSRSLPSASYTDSYNGKGTLGLQLKQYPVTAVSSVTVDGISVPQAQPATPSAQQSGYVFDDKFLYLVGGGYPFACYRFTRGFQNVQVAYTAGYTVIPFDVSQAIIELVATRYMERSRIGQKSKSLAGEVVSFFSGDLTDSVKGTLYPYRRVTPL